MTSTDVGTQQDSDLPRDREHGDPGLGSPRTSKSGRSTRISSILYSARTSPGLTLSILVLVLVALWAVFPNLFTSVDPLLTETKSKLLEPSSAHWFGTDALGRDQYSRVVHGARLSLEAAGLAVALAFVLGVLLGSLSGFVGGLLDDLVMRVVDVVMSIPGLLISLMLITALGFGTVNIAIAVGLASVAEFSRVTRSEVLRIRDSAYVEAARGAGGSWSSILRRHILPNAITTTIVLATLAFARAILSIAALSFLGFGAAAPAPEWGSLVAGGRDYVVTAWWLTTIPSLIIATVAVAANRISRALSASVAG